VKTSINKPIPPIVKEMVKFANLILIDFVAGDQFFVFKEIDDEGTIKTMDMERGNELIK